MADGCVQTLKNGSNDSIITMMKNVFVQNVGSDVDMNIYIE